MAHRLFDYRLSAFHETPLYSYGRREPLEAAAHFLEALAEHGWDECPECGGYGEAKVGEFTSEPGETPCGGWHDAVGNCPRCKGYGWCKV